MCNINNFYENLKYMAPEYVSTYLESETNQFCYVPLNLLDNYLYYDYVNFSTFWSKVFISLSPELFLMFAIIVYLCFIKNFNNFYISILFFYFTLVFELILLFSNILFFMNSGSIGTSLPILCFHSCFVFDIYSSFSKIVIIFFLIIIGIFSEFKLTWNKPISADIFIPVFFFIFFSLFLLSAFDLFTGYLALEGVSLSLYTLTANTYQKRVAIEASVKYLVFGGISNGILLFGNSIFFAIFGSLSYLEIKFLLNRVFFNLSSFSICVGLICFIIVFWFKVAAFPCHQWSPDVYEGVWLPITTILIVLVKLLYFFFFLKSFFMFSLS